MKKLTHIIASSLMVFGFVALVAPPAFAYDPIGDSAACDGNNPPKVCDKLSVPDSQAAVDGTVRNIINILLYVIGIISVIMIIVGGIKYTISNGDSAGITNAKNTILYAIVGLVVALMAYAIVNFVIARI